MPNQLKVTLLIIASTVSAFFLCEGLLRVIFPNHLNLFKINQFIESERGKFSKYDKFLGWRGRENVVSTFEWPDTKHNVKQNQFGFRGTGYSYERSKKKRIVFLGDSFVWGFGVEDNDIFSSIIERELKTPLEVINLGVSGYGTDQEYLLWEQQGSLWKPDEIVLMVTINNDPKEITKSVNYDYPKPAFKFDNGEFKLTNIPVPEKDTLFHEIKEGDSEKPENGILKTMFSKSTFLSMLGSLAIRNDLVRKILEKQNLIPTRLPGFGEEFSLYIPPSSNTAIEKPWIYFFYILKLFQNNTKGANLSVVIIPSNTQVYPELWTQYMNSIDANIIKKFKPDPSAPNKRIIKFCKENNIKLIDLLPYFQQEGLRNPYLYYPLNLHWTKDGHILAASVIKKKLNF